jgi:hypothetical protein
MTFAPLTDDLGAAVLMWCLEASLARTSALQARERESTALAPGSGRAWRELLAKFDPASSSWRTLQRSFTEDSGELFQTWPRSGMAVDGECWELPMLEPTTNETGSGLWLTPCATDAKPITGGNLYVTATATVRHMRPDGKSSNRGLSAQVKVWPTPIARDSRTVKGGARMTNSLGTEPLITQVALMEGATDGALNPMWVEWLMGWPIGWTDLSASETAKSPSAPQPHGGCSPANLVLDAAA